MPLLRSILRQGESLELVLSNYVGEKQMRSKSGEHYTVYHYQFVHKIGEKNYETLDHYATNIEHLSGMRTLDKFGEALSSIPERTAVSVELTQNGGFPARIWKQLLSPPSSI